MRALTNIFEGFPISGHETGTPLGASDIKALNKF
jgi:hypothetical protein